MEIFVFFGHLINFMLPAFWMATLLVAVHWMLYKRQHQRVSWRRHWLWLFGSGVAVLVLGLGIVQARFFWRTVSRSNDEKSSAR